jgi:hypothetical protein
MSTESMSDVVSFYNFIGEQIQVKTAVGSPEELLEAWRRQREYEGAVAAVEEGVRDMDAGRMRSVRELLSEQRSYPESGG